MKILMLGGGTGGHFYPIIAVAEAIADEALKEKILPPKLYFMAPDPYNKEDLFDHDIEYVGATAGKRRINPKGISKVRNFVDLFKMGFGVISAIFKVYFIMPDVVFSKGGFGAFPGLIAARFFRIPVIMHESDSYPGRVNMWAGKFAKKIALSYKEAAEFFPKDKVAYTGQPIRKEIREPLVNGAFEYLGLERNLPVILILGGSGGGKVINDSILTALPSLVKQYQIIHQTGRGLFQETRRTAGVILENSEFLPRYHVFDYLNTISMRMAAGAASLVISRGGSTIFEIACWGLPSILVPITDSNGDHQRKNSYNYARESGSVVIEEANLTPEILVHEIERIVTNKPLATKMGERAKAFARTDAAELIAHEVIKIGLRHEI
jgi:UDP-N-acetylglucosamine--N-acetylmuramyl-(pentapeptide) pyrophosphoryl-undecaprenol N-acetylglucosamine transferase